MPTVSIIIPTYNRADLIGRSIESVFAQSYTDWELIVVDDGSQDGTRAVVERYADPRLHYSYQQNAGTSAARNAGIHASQGTLIAFLDSDDCFLPDKLQHQAVYLAQHPQVGLVTSGWEEVDERGALLRTVRPWSTQPDLTLDHWLYSCPVVVPGLTIRRSWLEQVGFFDVALRYVEDWDLWLRLAHAGCPMEWIPELVCRCTMHQNSKVHNIGAMNQGIFAMFDKFFSSADRPERFIRQRDKIYANAHVDSMVRGFGAGDGKVATEHLLSALRLDPALQEGEPPAILRSLASTALTHVVDDPEVYVDVVCRSLAGALPALGYTPRRLRGLIRATGAFDDFANGRRAQARRSAAQALFMDARWLHNRGLLSILLKPW